MRGRRRLRMGGPCESLLSRCTCESVHAHMHVCVDWIVCADWCMCKFTLIQARMFTMGLQKGKQRKKERDAQTDRHTHTHDRYSQPEPDICMMPDIGNGFIASIVGFASMHVSGFFNGGCGGVSKAHLPSVIGITVTNAQVRPVWVYESLKAVWMCVSLVRSLSNRVDTRIRECIVYSSSEKNISGLLVHDRCGSKVCS